MQKLIFFGLLLIIVVSCGHNSQHKAIDSNLKLKINDSIIFTTAFQPSFAEYSLIKLIKVDTIQKLEILIKDDYRFDKAAKDTFYYKTVPISKEQFRKIDTGVIEKTKIKYKEKHFLGTEGMGVSFQLIKKEDTTRMGFWSPYKKYDVFGYDLTKAAIDDYKIAFNDQIISDYFDDVETYIDDSKTQVLFKKNRAINKLRIVKYKLHRIAE